MPTLGSGNFSQPKVITAAIGTLVLQGGLVLLQFLIAILLARFLGPQHYGSYALAIATVMVLHSPVQSVVGGLAVRFVATYQAQQKWGDIRRIWQWLVRWVGGYCAICAIFFVAYIAATSNSNMPRSLLYLSVLLFILMAISALCGSILRGLGYALAGQIPDALIRPGLLMATLVLAFSTHSIVDFHAEQIMAFHVSAASFSVIFGLSWVYRRFRCMAFSSFLSGDNEKWKKASIYLFLIGGVAVINSQVDVLMLGWLANIESVGVYRVSAQFSAMVAFGLTAINLVIAPRVSQLYSAQKMVALQKLLTISARINLLFAVPAAIIFLKFGDALLVTIVGHHFVDAYTPLIILSIGQVINAAAGPVGLTLNMIGREADVAKGIAISAMVNILLNYFLIPKFGMVGSAIATSASMVLWNLLLLLLLYQRAGLDCSALGINTHKFRKL